MKVVPGVEVSGAIVLNKAVGGINPDAVDHRVRALVSVAAPCTATVDDWLTIALRKPTDLLIGPRRVVRLEC